MGKKGKGEGRESNKERETKEKRENAYEVQREERVGEVSSNQKQFSSPCSTSSFTCLLPLLFPLPTNLFPILCEEHIDITRAAVSTEVHPTTHSVSICACRTKLNTKATLVVKPPIISMVTTAVMVPAWHAVHGIVTLTHLCVRGRVWCVMCVYA